MFELFRHILESVFWHLASVIASLFMTAMALRDYQEARRAGESVLVNTLPYAVLAIALALGESLRLLNDIAGTNFHPDAVIGEGMMLFFLLLFVRFVVRKVQRYSGDPDEIPEDDGEEARQILDVRSSPVPK